MRLVYAGTPAVALPALDALADGRHEIGAVITRPDAPTGRKRVLTPSPVAVRADELALPVIKAARADDELTAEIERRRPDLGVVVAYGALLRAPLLRVPRHGWINLHFSLLPRWRGAAPVQHAVIAGDRVTGASVFRLEEGLDTGPVYATLERPIGEDDTAGELLARLADEGAELLRGVVDAIAAGSARAVPQRGEPTFAPKLTLADATVDPSESGDAVSARIRGTTPEPGAHLLLGGDRLKVLAIRRHDGDDAPAPGRIESRGRRVLLGVADGAIELVTVHPAGKKAMSASDWWRGAGTDSLAVGAAR